MKTDNTQTDPFEVAMRELEKRGESLDRTLQQQREQFEYERDIAEPEDDEIVKDYRDIRG